MAAGLTGRTTHYLLEAEINTILKLFKFTVDAAGVKHPSSYFPIPSDTCQSVPCFPSWKEYATFLSCPEFESWI